MGAARDNMVHSDSASSGTRCPGGGSPSAGCPGACRRPRSPLSAKTRETQPFSRRVKEARQHGRSQGQHGTQRQRQQWYALSRWWQPLSWLPWRVQAPAVPALSQNQGNSAIFEEGKRGETAWAQPGTTWYTATAPAVVRAVQVVAAPQLAALARAGARGPRSQPKPGKLSHFRGG